MTALGAALHYDFEFPEDIRPIEALLERIVPEPRGFKQFCVPLTRKRERPTAYRLAKLMGRLCDRELFSFLVETPVTTPDHDSVLVGARLHPSTPTYGRFRFELALGSAVVARLGLQFIVDAVLELADAVAPCGGVMFPAETVIFASCLATGGGVGSLTPEQNKRTSELNYVLHWLRDKARGPEWGTFLSPSHVQTLGGSDRIRADSGCEVVRDLAGGGVYLQLTATLPAHDDVEHAARLAALTKVLAPVVLDPKTLP